MNINKHAPELAIGIEFLATLVLAQGTGTLVFLAAALTLHVGAAVVMGLCDSVSRSHRALMAALTLTLPFVGVVVVALTTRIKGRGEIAQFFSPRATVVRIGNVGDISRLTSGVSACEALVSSNPHERSAALAMIARMPNAANLRLLRWAIARAESEAAIESALALEDLNTQFEERVIVRRAELVATPGFDSALAAADNLADAIHTGLADECLFAVLSAEALMCYEKAETFAPERLHEFAARKAAFAPSLGGPG